MSEEVTIVVFRKWKKQQGVIALFPFLKWNSSGLIMSYEIIGEHGGADYDAVMKQTTKAKPSEFAQTERVLIARGYELNIRNKKPKEQTSYQEAYQAGIFMRPSWGKSTLMGIIKPWHA